VAHPLKTPVAHPLKTPIDNPGGTPGDNPGGTPGDNPGGTPDNPGDTPGDNPSTTPDGTILSDVAGGPFYTSKNNSALLSGPVIGTGAIANSALRKELRVRGLEDSPVIVERAYATRGGSLPRLIAALHNISPNSYCFVALEGVRLTDASGNANVGELFLEPFANGSLGNFLDQQYTDSCLAPGERVYADTILVLTWGPWQQKKYCQSNMS